MKMAWRGASRENDANTYKERWEWSYGSTGNYETRYGVLRNNSTTSTLQWHTSGIPRLTHDQTNKYRWGGANKLTTHQQCTHKLQNNKTTQSVLNSIIAVCEQHAKYQQPPKCSKQDMWEKLFKSSTSLSKKIIQRSHTQEDLQVLTWTKITDFGDLVKISDSHQVFMLWSILTAPKTISTGIESAWKLTEI